MIRVGVVGLGMMGATHLEIYSRNPLAKLVAVADKNPDILEGRAAAFSNIAGAGGAVDTASLKRYSDAADMIADPDVDLIDICLWTPLHVPIAKAALEAGKHVLLEKPLARDSAGSAQLVEAARNAKGKCMVAMCMRFWPGWDWLKTAIDENRYGKPLAAHFRRWGQFPGGSFYSSGEASGGGLLDTHIHDVDFVQHCFGMPQAVTTFGISRFSGQPDQAVTHYHYADGPMVTAEVAWLNVKNWPFRMEYDVVFEKATASYNLASDQPLTVYHNDGDPETIDIDPVLGYELEIDHFLKCIDGNSTPRVTFEDAAKSIAIYEAEVRSAEAGGAKVAVV